jgi:RHS repeat-associated protein
MSQSEMQSTANITPIQVVEIDPENIGLNTPILSQNVGEHTLSTVLIKQETGYPAGSGETTQTSGETTQNHGETTQTAVSNPIESATPGVTMAIAGSPGVSPSGAATYSIPLTMPPGTGGVQPNLSIVYSSRTGDGLLGYGFRLSGLSSIARIPTPHRDGGFKAVTLTDDDSYALNGQQLHLDASASSGCRRYYTEYENFMEITMCNEAGYTDNDGRQYFVVKAKDGMVMEYGSAQDSRVVVDMPGGAKRVLEWKLSKLTDPAGRYIAYSYGTVNGEHVLQSIAYTGTSGFTPYNTVQLEYQARNSSSGSFYYVADKRLPRNNVLLSGIKIKNSQGATLLRYALSYSQDQTQYRLTSLQQYAHDETKLVTNFTWNRRQLLSGTTTALDSDVRKVYFADMDGDGLDEMVKLYANSTAKIFKVNGLSVACMGSVTFSPNTLDLALQMIDVNGNGLNDIVATDNFSLRIFMNMGNMNFTQRYERINFGISGFEVKGTESCKSNVCILVKKNDTELTNRINSYTTTHGSQFCADSLLTFVDSMITLVFSPDLSGAYQAYAQKILGDVTIIPMGDVDGNGKEEVVVTTREDVWTIAPHFIATRQDAYQPYIRFFSSDGIFDNRAVEAVEWLGQNCKNLQSMGDFNGDGKTDLLLYRKEAEQNRWSIAYATGSGYAVHAAPLSCKPEEGGRVLVCDLNGDGKADIVEAYPSGKQAIFKGYLAAGAEGNFVVAESQTLAMDYDELKGAHITSAKLTASEACAVFVAANPNASWRWVRFGEHAQPEVTAITDNMGYEVGLEYADMPQRYDGFAPSVGLTAPTRVVSKITIPSTVGGHSAVQYTFSSPKTNTDRNCFHGFARVSARDTTNKEETLNTYRLFSTLGLLPDSSITLADGEAVAVVSHSYARQLSYRGLPMVRITHKRIVNNLTGVAENAAYAYNSYGNIVADSLDNGEQLVTGSYGAWVGIGSLIPSLPQQIITTTTLKSSGERHADSATVSYDGKGRVASSRQNGVTATYEYHPTHGATTKATLSADDVAQPHVTAITYNSYGCYPTSVREGEHEALTESYGYDARGLGLLTSYTDMYGRTTSYEHDGLGRIVEETLPGGVKVSTQYAPESVGGSSYSVATSAPGLGYSKTYFDLLGREVGRIDMGVGGQHTATTMRYNSRGLVEEMVAPTTMPGDTQVVRYQYDRYGRLARQTDYRGAVERSYSGLSATTHNSATGRTQQSRTNAQGMVVAAGDEGGEVAYCYNVRGLPASVTVTAGGSSLATSMAYDRYGRQTLLNDPTGAVTYRYNAFGELVAQADAAGNTLALEYDEHGRLTKKTLYSPAFGADTFRYAYYGSLPDSIVHNGATVSRYEYYEHSDLLKSETEYIDGLAFERRYAYNSMEQLSSVTGPSGLTLTCNYDNAGNLTSIAEGSKTLWGDPTYNAAQQLTGYTLGNGTTAQLSYTRHGQLTGISARSPQGSPILQLGYAVDPATGNLTERTDAMSSLAETFEYDSSDRLTRWGDKTAAYAANGNILYKSDAGSFAYGENHGDGGTANPYAISSMTTPQAMQPDQRIAYNATGKVATVAQGTDSLAFAYGHHGQRTKMSRFCNGALVSVRYYSGGFERTVNFNENYTKDVHYLSAESGIFAAYEHSSDGAAAWYYLYVDHLGSLALATNAQGQPCERRSYDAWGQPESAAWHFSRGYTGHEHLPEFGLINMNGRMYDPLLGRMLSPDPYVQAPEYAQCYNRYSYCLNNPLAYTDPTGMETVYNGGMLPEVVVIGRRPDDNRPTTSRYELGFLNVSKKYLLEQRRRRRQRSDMEEMRYRQMIRHNATHVSSVKIHNIPAPAATSPPPPPPSPLPESSSGMGGRPWSDALDGVQLGLDALGLFPGIGEFFDLGNAAIYTLRGDHVNAHLSMAACVPFVGWAAAGGRFAGKVTGKTGTSVIKGFTEHATNQAIERGFKTSDVLKIVKEGTAAQVTGRYGTQTRYVLGGNTVVVNAQGKVVTVFSNAPGTTKDFGKGRFIPFE